MIRPQAEADRGRACQSHLISHSAGRIRCSHNRYVRISSPGGTLAAGMVEVTYVGAADPMPAFCAPSDQLQAKGLFRDSSRTLSECIGASILRAIRALHP